MPTFLPLVKILDLRKYPAFVLLLCGLEAKLLLLCADDKHRTRFFGKLDKLSNIYWISRIGGVGGYNIHDI